MDNHEEAFTPRVPELDLSQGTELLGEFLSEAEDHLSVAESAVLALETAPSDAEEIAKIFRAFHTIKGAAGFLNLEDMKVLTHNAETMMDMVRKGTMGIDARVTETMLAAIDAVRKLVALLREQLANNGALTSPYYDVSPVLAAIRAVIAGGQAPRQEQEPAPQPAPAELPKDVPPPVIEPPSGGTIQFTPRVPVLDLSQGPDLLAEFLGEGADHLANAEAAILALEQTPGVAEEIDKIFRAFHTIKGVAGFLNLDDVKTLTHDAETVMDMVRKGVMGFDAQIAEAMLLSLDSVRKLLSLLQEQMNNQGTLQSPYFDITPTLVVIRSIIANKSGAPLAAPATPPRKIGEILVDKEIITDHELANALEKQRAAGEPPKKLGEILVEEGSATAAQVTRTLQEQKKAATAGEEVIKIGTSKLDALIDNVGELVIVGTQVIQSRVVKNSDDIKLSNDITQMEKIIRDIQDISMTLRLVPIKGLFQKMVRMVRDLAKKAGKNVTVQLSGEDTEIDKNIIDLVSDPLMHMIRNSVDHGIELPEARRSLGKPETGTVELHAFHKGGNIAIQIRDDGGGLKKDRILKKARESGLVKEGDVLDDNRIFSLIFEPGFSTAEKVTDISGRGVGMDVVKRNVEKLRGRIDIESEENKGSTFTIKLPLTLAIIDGVILEVGDQRYIVPVSSIVKFVRPRTTDLTTPAGGRKEMLLVHGQLYDLIRLDRYFSVKPRYRSMEESTICVVDSDYGSCCIMVDEILGQQQVVIKSLGEWFEGLKYLAGGAILGDGKVGLILDINNIVAAARQQ